jgi:hypothetical protein
MRGAQLFQAPKLFECCVKVSSEFCISFCQCVGPMSLQDMGHPMSTSQQPRTAISVLLPVDQLQALDAFAAADRRTRSAAAALAIEQFLARVVNPRCPERSHSVRGGTADTAGRLPAVSASFKTRGLRK